jgi:hypothetical protein
VSCSDHPYVFDYINGASIKKIEEYNQGDGKHIRSQTLIVIPGIFPRVPEEATRHRIDVNWMGDLWKLPEIFRTFRPDLQLLELDVEPAGLLLVTALDPKNTVFVDKRKELALLIQQTNPPPPEILQRRFATVAEDIRLTAYLQNIRATES